MGGPDALLGGDNIANIQRITVVADPANANGSAFGGIRAGNAAFGGDAGVVGISAANVAIQDVVTIGDINASGTATPSLAFGANSQFGNVTVAGGDLVNSKTIANSGYRYDVVLAAGTTSGGTTLPAQNTYSQLSFTQAPNSVVTAIPTASQTVSLTTAVDSLSGGSGNDTFNATAVDAVTGLAATNLNPGDKINGGAGRDTLNITVTADHNRVFPAAGNLTSVEVVNITNANNLQTVTSNSSSIADAGSFQVAVLDLNAAKPTAEVQSLDFSGITVGTGGNVSVAGVSVALAAGDGPAAIASKVQQALSGNATFMLSANSVAAQGGKVTVTYKTGTVAAPTTFIDPAPTALDVSTDLNANPVVLAAGGFPTTVTDKEANLTPSVTVTINGVQYTTDAITTTAAQFGSIVAAPTPPAVATTQGVAAVTESSNVTFGALTAGQSVTVNGLTLTAGASITAAQVATFFKTAHADTTAANTAAGVLGGSATGLNTAANFSVAAITGSTTALEYTSAATTAANVTDIAVAVSAVGGATAPAAPTVATTQGVAAVTESSNVTFGALTAGQSVTVNGLTLTAGASITAAQVATFFKTAHADTTAANTAAGVLGGAATGINDVTEFSVAAITGSTTALAYTSANAGQNVADIAVATQGSTAAAAEATALSNTRVAVKTVLNNVLGGTVTVGDGDDLNEVRLSSKALGAALPLVSIAQGSSALSSVDGLDEFVVSNQAKTGASGNVAQVITINVADGNTANFAGNETFEVFIDGSSYGVTTIAANATEANVASSIAGAISGVLGAGTAAAVGNVVTITAPVAGTALPHLNVKLTTAVNEGSLTIAQSVANQKAITPTVTTTTTPGSISVSTNFSGAEEVWLAGSSGAVSLTGVGAAQAAGFNGVSSMANTVTFGNTVTAGTIATSGSSGALTVGNALTSLSIIGAGTSGTGISLTDGAGTDTIATLNVSTTGGTTLNVAGLTALTTVSSTGAGGLTLASGAAAQKLASITSGDGADTIMIRVATAVDNVATSANETVSASLNSGAGADRLAINVSGPGILSVDAGTGNDLIVLNSLTDGTNTIAGGDGNDEIIATTVASLGKTTINGGAGTDTLRTTTTLFTASDYTLLNTNVTGVETLRLTSAPTALDASKVSMTTFDLRATGSSITGVGSAQSVVLQPTAGATAVTDILDSVTAVNSTALQSLTLVSKGYVPDSDATLAGDQTVFGDDLNVTLRQVASNATLSANGNKLAVSISSLGATTSVSAVASAATISGDLRSIEATLTSARGSAASESIAGVTVSTPQAGGNLSDLESIKVSGSGAVTIDAGVIAGADAKLKVIDLSAMTAFPNQNALGQNVDAGGSVDGYQNLSTSAVTLNSLVAETLTLGAGDDAVTTGSTVLAMDSIRGFSLVATAADSKVIDVSRSDELNVGGTETTFVKMTTTASTLNGAVIQAAGLMSGATHQQNVVFHFNGNTYVYVDTGAEGLTDGDRLIELVGLYDLDLLISGTGATKALKGGGGL